MEFNDVFKFASIRNTIYNVNVRSEPRPKRPIPHFTQSTYTLLDNLRLNKPRIVHGFKCKTRLQKVDGTYFTDQEEEQHYYELEQYFEWMNEQYDKEHEEQRQEDSFDIPITDTWRFSK